jgi:hypothetical protein
MSFFRSAGLPSLVGSMAMVLSVAVLAAAQNPPLADVARKEQERRKALHAQQQQTTGEVKVLTNKDLPQVNPAPASAGGVDAQKGEPAAQPKEQAPESPVRNEAWWRARITEVRDQLARDQVLLDALQARVNGLTSDFVGRDDPYQRARIGEDRQKAIVEMDRVRTDVADFTKKIDDIEEEARKAGVPPGWLR